jgi:DNA-directed RNA polymerase specialized sigma24 family protein
LAAPRRSGAPFAPAAAALLVDGSAAADEAVVLLEAWAAGLPPLDGAILLLRVRDRATAAETAAALGLHRRTLDRRWRRLRGRLRRELAAAEAAGEGLLVGRWMGGKGGDQAPMPARAGGLPYVTPSLWPHS